MTLSDEELLEVFKTEETNKSLQRRTQFIKRKKLWSEKNL